MEFSDSYVMRNRHTLHSHCHKKLDIVHDKVCNVFGCFLLDLQHETEKLHFLYTLH